MMSRYPLPLIAIYVLAALALIAGAVGIGRYLEEVRPGYDYANPDVAFLERIVLSGTPRRGDFSGLNGGDWRALCLVGHGADVSAALQAANIRADLSEAIAQHVSARAGDIGETEFMLAYVDSADAVKSVLHPHGFAFARAGQARCLTPEEPLATLPVE